MSGVVSLLNESLVFNQTTAEEDDGGPLKVALDSLLIVVLVVIMLAMGCDISFRQVWDHLRRPIGVTIGLGCQFVMMPFLGFAFSRAFGLEPRYATGVLIISCCPGGTISNIFTYFCDGDVSLSVTMTSVSVVVALGGMPLNLLIYGTGTNLVIPYIKIVLSLVSVTVPAFVGMLIRFKFKRIATYVTKVGGWLSFIIITILIALEVLIFPDVFVGVDWAVYFIVAVMPLAGCGLGFGIAKLCKQDMRVCKTVAIESGVQNSAIALTVIFMSFSIEVQRQIVLFPWLYGLSMMFTSALICAFYHVYIRCCPSNKELECEKVATVSYQQGDIITQVPRRSSDPSNKDQQQMTSRY